MSVVLGPKLGLLFNADEGETYTDQFRPFLRALDAYLFAAVINTTTAAPPTSPNPGDAYLVAAGATGVWTGQSGNIAVYSNQLNIDGSDTVFAGWEFHDPNEGWKVWDAATTTTRIYTQGQWKAAPTLIKEIALNPTEPGNFQVAHGLPTTPSAVAIEMTSNGQIWFQNTRYDGTNLYLVASGYPVTGFAKVWS